MKHIVFCIAVFGCLSLNGAERKGAGHGHLPASLYPYLGNTRDVTQEVLSGGRPRSTQRSRSTSALAARTLRSRAGSRPAAKETNSTAHQQTQVLLRDAIRQIGQLKENSQQLATAIGAIATQIAHLDRRMGTLEKQQRTLQELMTKTNKKEPDIKPSSS